VPTGWLADGLSSASSHYSSALAADNPLPPPSALRIWSWSGSCSAAVWGRSS